MESFLTQHKIWIEVFSAVGLIIVALLALWPTINRFFFPIKLELGIDEKIGFVISEDQKIRKIQLGFNFINIRNKNLVINRIIAEIFRRDDANYIFDWNMFIEDYYGAGTAPKRRPAPIMLKPNDSHYEMIQFFRENEINLTSGEYNLKIKIWINQKDIQENPRVTRNFHFIVSDEDIILINKEKNEIAKGKEPKWRLVHIPLKNWDFKNL